MTTPQDIVHDLESRALVTQLAGGDDLKAHLNEAPRVVYCGFEMKGLFKQLPVFWPFDQTTGKRMIENQFAADPNSPYRIDSIDHAGRSNWQPYAA